MKILLRSFILFVALTLASVSYAQTFGVQAGLNLPTMYLEIEEDVLSEDFDQNPGFHVGATVEFPIKNAFSFQTGVLLSTKGFKVSQEETLLDETFEIDGELNLFYIDIPLTARASFDVGGTEVYGLFGPYIGYGFSGKRISKISFMGQTETEEVDVEWGNEEDDNFQSLDFGLTAGLGVEYNSFLFGLSYDFGLANIMPAEALEIFDATAKHRVVRVSVGYKFGGE